MRLGFLGNTRKGKTFGMAWLIDELRARGLLDVVLVTDDKNQDPPYRGMRRVNPADLAAHPPADEEDAGLVVYRGVSLDPARTVDVNDVAGQAWALTLQGARVLLVPDELRRAVSPAGREWRAPNVARALTEGGGVNLSVFWGTQSPQRIPVEGFDQSTLLVFNLGYRGRSYLEKAGLLSPAVSAAIGALAPRQFIVVDDAGDWDGVVYEVPFRPEAPPASDGGADPAPPPA